MGKRKETHSLRIANKVLRKNIPVCPFSPYSQSLLCAHALLVCVYSRHVHSHPRPSNYFLWLFPCTLSLYDLLHTIQSLRETCCVPSEPCTLDASSIGVEWSGNVTAVGSTSTRRGYGLGSAVGVLRGMMTSKSCPDVWRLSDIRSLGDVLGLRDGFSQQGWLRGLGPSWRTISKASDAVICSESLTK